MKKFFILALLALAFTSCDYLEQWEDQRDQYVTEEVAKLLEVPAESVDIDFDDFEIYDAFWIDKLIGKASSSKISHLYIEKNSGKKFIVEYDGAQINSIEFAPEEE
jgi:hypothetical protein